MARPLRSPCRRTQNHRPAAGTFQRALVACSSVRSRNYGAQAGCWLADRRRHASPNARRSSRCSKRLYSVARKQTAPRPSCVGSPPRTSAAASQSTGYSRITVRSSRPGVPGGACRDRFASHFDAARHAAMEWQSREIHPDAERVGLRRCVPHERRAPSRLTSAAALLQRGTTT